MSRCGVFVRILWAAAALAGGVSTAPAAQPADEVSVTPVTEGYHRPGRYMPLRIRVAVPSAGPEAFLAIRGPGAVETRVPLTGGRAAGVVPLLVLEPIRELTWEVRGSGSAAGPTGTVQAPWRSLLPGQRLVGFTSTVDMDLGRVLFPGDSVIPVRLEEADALPGPATAWELLDGLVLNRVAQLRDGELGALLAGAVTIAVRSGEGLDFRRPWEAVGGAWTLRYSPSGPPLAGDNPAAMGPVQGWRGDWPAPFRWRIYLAGTIYCIVILGAALLRPKWAVPIILVLSAGTAIGLGIWWRSRSSVLQRGGEIIVATDDWTQTDSWRYLASPSPTPFRVEWLEGLRPVFEQRGDVVALKLALCWREDSAFFTGQLQPGLVSGWLWRTVESFPPPQSHPQADSTPLDLLAQRSYLRPGDHIEGYLPAPRSTDTEHWGSLLIDAGRR